jgi:hypothetical protein
MMAGSAIDLNEIVSPKILDPRQVEGLHGCSGGRLGGLEVSAGRSRLRDDDAVLRRARQRCRQSTPCAAREIGVDFLDSSDAYGQGNPSPPLGGRTRAGHPSLIWLKTTLIRRFNSLIRAN